MVIRLARVPSASLADQAAEAIARLIAGLDPGSRLGTKDDLRAQVGVSSGTFNEALRLLQARGLVSVRRGPGGGLFSAAQSPMAQLGEAVLGLDIDASSVAEAVRMRNALDPLLIEDAVLHSSAQDIRAMRQHLDTMADAVGENHGIAFLHANWQLHACIAAASPHPYSARYTSACSISSNSTRSRSRPPPASRRCTSFTSSGTRSTLRSSTRSPSAIKRTPSP